MRTGILAVIFCLSHTPAWADVKEWYEIPGIKSARLAEDNWDLQSSTGLSWPDGRQAIVTFWLAPLKNGMVRCVAFFDADFRSTGEICGRNLVTITQ